MFSRVIHPSFELLEGTVKMIKQAGCRIILDLDDYWILERNHVIYYDYSKNQMQKNIESSIKYADAITTSTKLSGILFIVSIQDSLKIESSNTSFFIFFVLLGLLFQPPSCNLHELKPHLVGRLSLP